MKYFADLHIHSKYSRATSRELNIQNLEKFARIKGIDILGTGDFQHPRWLKELKSQLTEDGSGILKTNSGFPFVLQTEISLMYSQGGKGRRVHNVVLAPSFEVADHVQAFLERRGRIDYDGRPIFKMNCPEFVRELKSISNDIEIIPAHIWTPWFSLYGSKSGFNSIRDCFQDQLKHIHAIETGLSSDPPMNWRLSELDDYSILSFSDLHSFWPWRIGRESTIFDLKELSYKSLISAIRTREGLVGTVEVDPAYGKYHYDGHRNCKVSWPPHESINAKNICPVCHKPLTIGVLHRVEELADREEGFVPKNAKPFHTLLPLSEIISKVKNIGIATKAAWRSYYKIIGKDSNELDALLNMPASELEKRSDRRIAAAVVQARESTLKMKPGFDGTYGEFILDEDDLSGSEQKEYVEDSRPKSQKGIRDYF